MQSKNDQLNRDTVLCNINVEFLFIQKCVFGVIFSVAPSRLGQILLFLSVFILLHTVCPVTDERRLCSGLNPKQGVCFLRPDRCCCTTGCQLQGTLLCSCSHLLGGEGHCLNYSEADIGCTTRLIQEQAPLIEDVPLVFLKFCFSFLQTLDIDLFCQ